MTKLRLIGLKKDNVQITRIIHFTDGCGADAGVPTVVDGEIYGSSWTLGFRV